jgi:hypothetical protein
MDEKPKRKRRASPPEIDFVTALTVEECLEQLERGPARTLDYRLSVRTDGMRFKVEALADRAPMAVLAELDGYLLTWPNGTRVTARSETKYKPDSPYWALAPILVSFLYAYIYSKNSAWFLVLIPAIGVFAALLMLKLLARIADRALRQIPDLDEWLRQQIYEPPSLPEE